MHPEHGGGKWMRAVFFQRLSARLCALGGQARRAASMHPVEHDRRQRHLLGRQPLHEVGRLTEGVALRRGDDHERGARLLQQAVGVLRAFAEAAEHGLQRRDEQAEVLQRLTAEHAGEHAREHVEPDREHLHVSAPARLRGREQHPDHAAVEKAAQPLGRVEEVERRPARRRVDHDEIPSLLRLELTKLFHGHVLLRTGEARRQRDVEGVGEDLLGPGGLGMAEDDLIERPLHVQHHCVEAAVTVDAADSPRGVVQLAQAHRLSQPPGRVDGEHAHPAATLGRPQRDCSGGGRLAHATGAAAHDDGGGVE